MVPSGDLLILNSAGPNVGNANRGFLTDARALSCHPKLLNSLRIVCSYTGNRLMDTLAKDLEGVNLYQDHPAFPKGPESFLLGRLCEKLEPAGKIRVFAIIDA